MPLLSVLFLYYVTFGSEDWVQGLCMSRALPASPEAPVHNHTPQVFPGTIKGHRKEGRKTGGFRLQDACVLCMSNPTEAGCFYVLSSLSFRKHRLFQKNANEIKVPRSLGRIFEEYLKNSFASTKWAKTTDLWRRWAARGPDALAHFDSKMMFCTHHPSEAMENVHFPLQNQASFGGHLALLHINMKHERQPGGPPGESPHWVRSDPPS